MRPVSVQIRDETMNAVDDRIWWKASARLTVNIEVEIIRNVAPVADNIMAQVMEDVGWAMFDR